ncbi:MAG: hemC [Oscillospiraceae bacterium]|nr:hemC [Oscillospiraceae bacterium]
MLNNEIDFAVHSAKDMPSEFPKGLGIAGAIKRDDFHDVLISKYKNIRELPQNAIVGTSSPRREVHIKAIRDNIQIKLLRGNILTRLKRYDDGEYDAIILAKAGLDRLNVVRDDVNVIDTEDMIPAVCQGIIAVEGRIDDEKNEIIRKISCDETYRTMICERGFMQQVGGGCSAPIAALATVSDEEMKVVGMIEQNGKIKKDMLIGDVSEFKDLGRKLAIKIKNAL